MKRRIRFKQVPEFTPAGKIYCNECGYYEYYDMGGPSGYLCRGDPAIITNKFNGEIENNPYYGGGLVKNKHGKCKMFKRNISRFHKIKQFLLCWGQS